MWHYQTQKNIPWIFTKAKWYHDGSLDHVDCKLSIDNRQYSIYKPQTHRCTRGHHIYMYTHVYTQYIHTKHNNATYMGKYSKMSIYKLL